MREIKFRAWDDALDNMFNWEKLSIDKDGVWVNVAPNYRLIDKTLILMQYTGLKDKNGVEIYEGDVVKTWHDDDISYDDNDNEIVVEYITTVVRDFNIIEVHNCEWDIWTLQFASEAGHNFEVIGNIYEHPGLLQ